MSDPFRALRLWLTGDATAQASDSREAQIERAAAVLLVEAARLDGTYSEVERMRIRTLLGDRFGLSPAQAETLARAGEDAQDGAVELFGFVRTLMAAMSETERQGLIEMLWEVVYADGRLHDFEANMMRRIAGLLHVDDRASAEARQRVLRRLAGGSSGEGAVR